MMRRRCLGIPVCALLLAGCLATRGTDTQQDIAQAHIMKLVGTPWRAETIRKQMVSPDIDSTLELTPDTQILGHGGCNRYESSLTIRRHSVRVTRIFVAKMVCAPERLEQEKRFFNALAAVRHIRLDDEQLLLLDRSGTIVLRMTRLSRFAKRA